MNGIGCLGGRDGRAYPGMGFVSPYGVAYRYDGRVWRAADSPMPDNAGCGGRYEGAHISANAAVPIPDDRE